MGLATLLTLTQAFYRTQTQSAKVIILRQSPPPESIELRIFKIRSFLFGFETGFYLVASCFYPLKNSKH